VGRILNYGASVAIALTLAACGGHSRYLDVGSVPPGVTVQARIDYYDVTAATLAELRRGMAELGPRLEGRRWQAAAQSRLRWTWKYGRSGIGCRLDHVRVHVETVVTFPRWNPTAEPDSATLEWWQQFNAGLVEHERGHAQISVKTAGDIVRELEGMTHPQCDLLGNQASAAANRHMRQSQTRQTQYDRTTRHGATQIQQAGRLRAP
jgi:predicted secreted Zn-dependent protease